MLSDETIQRFKGLKTLSRQFDTIGISYSNGIFTLPNDNGIYEVILHTQIETNVTYTDLIAVFAPPEIASYDNIYARSGLNTNGPEIVKDIFTTLTFIFKGGEKFIVSGSNGNGKTVPNLTFERNVTILLFKKLN